MHPELRPLILASASPRRHQLLATLGEEFEVLVPDVDETLTGAPARSEVQRLAMLKAEAVLGRREEGTVLAADTVVELDRQILGKPVDADDARRMLRGLSGSEHQVHTGVVVLNLATGMAICAAETTRIRMRPISEEELEAYIASGEPMGKAGSYAVQETGDRFVVSMEGEYDNVVGLPMARVRRLLDGLADSLGLEEDLPPV